MTTSVVQQHHALSSKELSSPRHSARLDFTQSTMEPGGRQGSSSAAPPASLPPLAPQWLEYDPFGPSAPAGLYAFGQPLPLQQQQQLQQQPAGLPSFGLPATSRQLGALPSIDDLLPELGALPSGPLGAAQPSMSLLPRPAGLLQPPALQGDAFEQLLCTLDSAPLGALDIPLPGHADLGGGPGTGTSQAVQELPDWELGGLGSLDDEDLLGEDPLDLPFTFGAGPPAGVGRESVRVSSGLYKARQGALLRQVSPDQGASQAPGPSPGTDSSSGRGTSSTRGGSSGRGGEGGKPKRVRVRNAEQQAKNKAAQQRYRERKRQTDEALQEQIEALSQQVEQLPPLTEIARQEQELLARNQALQASLAAAQEQLDRATADTSVPRATAGAASSSRGDSTIELALAQLGRGAAAAGGEQSPPASPPVPDPAAVQAAHQQMQFTAQLLQQEVQHQESAPSAPSWDSTSHTLVQLTLQLLGQLRQASHTTRRLRLSTDAHAGLSPSEAQAAQFGALTPAFVASLGLGADQRFSLALARADTERKLAAAGQERQSLHAELVRSADAQGPGSQPEVGRQSLDWMSRAGEAAGLRSILERLQASLRQERQILTELQHSVCRRIMVPLQAAKLALASLPGPIDALGLCHLAAPSAGQA